MLADGAAGAQEGSALGLVPFRNLALKRLKGFRQHEGRAVSKRGLVVAIRQWVGAAWETHAITIAGNETGCQAAMLRCTQGLSATNSLRRLTR